MARGRAGPCKTLVIGAATPGRETFRARRIRRTARNAFLAGSTTADGHMVDARSVAAVVTGALLAILGGLGAVVVLVGTLAGVMEWTTVAWLLLLGFVVGAGLLTYGAVALAGDLWAVVADGDLGGLTEDVDASRLRHLVD